MTGSCTLFGPMAALRRQLKGTPTPNRKQYCHYLNPLWNNFVEAFFL